MDPLLLRSAFRIAFAIFAIALVILPFEDRASPEFVVTVITIGIGLLFLAIVTFLARASLPPHSGRSGRTQSTKQR